MLHEAELLQSDERAAQRYGRQAEELRDLLEREKEEQSQRERERARQRCGRAEGAQRGLGLTARAAASHLGQGEVGAQMDAQSWARP